MRKHIIAMLISLIIAIINALIIRYDPHFFWLLLDYPTIIVVFGYVMDFLTGFGLPYLILGWSTMVFLHSLVILITFASCRSSGREMTYVPVLITDVIMVLCILLCAALFYMAENILAAMLIVGFNWYFLAQLLVIDICHIEKVE